MENGIQAVPETSPKEVTADEQKHIENIKRTVEMLNTVHYLLNTGSFAGKDSELVVVAKDFLIGFKKHLTGSENKQ